MSDLDPLYARNAQFAEAFTQGDLPIRPQVASIILTCVDARVDPAHFAGLELGDALTLRNVGGRVTDTVMLEVAMLWLLMKVGLGAEPNLGLAIIHHSGCGMARFADPQVAAAVTAAFGTTEVVETYAISDHRESVRTDVQRALDSARTPAGLRISGHAYDIATGRLERVTEEIVAS